ncbi:ATP-binding protein [Anaerosolibacter carboniphilus]|nr:ATP-binding protein [Anaerosolibacter carboniphilus]
MSQNATSSCPFSVCDGSGMIIDQEKNSVAFCKCRDAKIVDKKLEFANIPKEFYELTIKSFDTEVYSTEENKSKATLAKRAAANFVNNYETMAELGKGIYFYSYVKGSGKTRLAASLGNALVKVKMARVKFITTVDLLKAIQNTYNKESEITETELLYAIKTVDVLILDDIGVETPKTWVTEIFYNIINGRMVGKKITIFTSNVPIEELAHDERIKNRIEKMAVPIYLPDESIRSSIAKQENEDLQEILFK